MQEIWHSHWPPQQGPMDPLLLGGALIRIGDRVIDRSVRSLLDVMEQRLMETSV